MEDTEAEGLYALPLEEFTAARNKLAAARRKAGDRPGADAVRSLPKPSRTAWALNQLARRHPEIVERVLHAGQALRAAHARALEGDAGDLRAATRKEHEAVRAAVEAARGVLAEGGGPPSAAQLDRLRHTVQAAAVSTDTGEHFRAGRLVADLHPSGFVLDDATGSEPAQRAQPARARSSAANQRAEVDREETAARHAARVEARRRAMLAEAEKAQRRAAELEKAARDARRMAHEALDVAAASRRTAEEAAC